VIDVLAYSYVSSDMRGSDWKIFEKLVKERLRYYSYIIYTPVEFRPAPEHDRADLRLQEDIARIIEAYLEQWGLTYLHVSGDVRKRTSQIEEFLQ
jgi:hypothetical protein